MRINYVGLISSVFLFTLFGVTTTVAAEQRTIFDTAHIAPKGSYPPESSSDNGFAAALRATLYHHPMLKGKRSEVSVQEYAISSAKAKRYPTLSTQLSSLSDYYDEAIVRLDQPLWAFGKIDNAIEIAESGLIAEQWRLLDVQRQLLEQTAASYAKIEGIKKREQVAHNNISAHQGYYDRIARRQQGALSSEADMRLAYARLLQAKTELQSINGELLVAETDLYALTQIRVSTKQEISPHFAQLPAYSYIERLAIENEATVLLKRQNLKVARLAVKSEKLAILPTLYLSMEKDLLDHPNSDGFRAGLTFSSSLEGLGFVRLGRIKGVEARLSAAYYDLDSAINDVRRRVNSLMLNRRVQKKLITAQKQTVNAMEETLASFLRQYETGRKTWLEVLNTQREVKTLQSQLVQSENDWLVISLRVATLTGGLDQLAGLHRDEQ